MRPKTGVTAPWPAEKIETAIAMWKEGKSAGVIGAAIGVTRNAVCGYVSRNRDLFARRGKSYQPSEQRARTKREPRPRTPPAAKAKPVRNWCTNFFGGGKGQPSAPADEPMKPKQFDVDRLPVAKRLHELSSKDCRWPINDGGPYLFCAAATETGKYCEHHTARTRRA